MGKWIFAVVAVLALGVGIALQERARAGVEVRYDRVGTTPVTVTQQAGAEGPVVVIVHGFAGSRQMMSAWSLTFARAGYVAVAMDLEGHGRNPVPMSGDVTSLEGTTRILLEEIARVVDWAVALPGVDGRVALVGHSMSSDLVVRAGIADPRVEAIVGLSVFSGAVTADVPTNLLILNGAWEGALRAEAQRVMAEVDAVEGETVGTPVEGFARRAVAVPFAEHVSILFAVGGLREAVDWLGATFGRGSGEVPRLGWALMLLLAGAVMLARPLAGLLPQGDAPEALPQRVFWVLALLPALVVPLVAVRIEAGALPVLVADYLAVHLGLYGLLVLGGALVAGWRPQARGWMWGLALAAFGIGVFGMLLDRYAASFVPHAGRLLIIAAIVPGAVLAMWADAALTQATRATLWQRAIVRGGFMGSLGIAVALDFERLFFLLLIFPVILLFYGTFGMMGRWVGRRTGSSLAVGIGLGVLLGWALGVSFPMYVAGG
ncbi:alpha/beta hydrolase [Rhodobacteraceae bacterium N5(2021)]|uniref:Alpha/beta hydrolase n=1 Tax=Gymnodinialimonas phycosphaerae TaxID=2841589 RepID=A0A975TTH8_9RHOB|nr:alpha/beta hydrolase [Gymnodinialimonas phycosphaerae]MBY4894309.1 alpha/beta hydrolase [Gymnodinialimonas phycosphaerae]